MIKIILALIFTAGTVFAADIRPERSIGGPDWLTVLRFSRDGRYFAAGGGMDYDIPSMDHPSEGWLKVWSLPGGEMVKKFDGNKIYAVDFSSDAKSVAFAEYPGEIRLFSLPDWESIKTLKWYRKYNRHYLCKLKFSPDNKYLAATGAEGVRLWSMPKGKSLKTLKNPEGDSAFSIAFSPDGLSLAVGYDKTIKLWSVPDMQLMKTIVFGDRYGGVSFSPDGKYLAASSGHTIKLFTMPDAIPTRTFGRENYGSIKEISFSPDGKYLASADSFCVPSCTLSLWSVEDGRLIRTLRGHTNGVAVVDFSPEYLASGSSSWKEGSEIKLWPAGAGSELLTDNLRNALELARSGGYEKALAEYSQFNSGDMIPEDTVTSAMRAEFMGLMAPTKEKYIKQFKSDMAAGKTEDGSAGFNKVMGLAADDNEEKAIRAQFFAVIRKMEIPPVMSEEARKAMIKAELNAKNGDLKACAEEYVNALRLAPFAAKLYYNLAIVYGEGKGYKAARKWMGVYLEAAPEAPDARAAKDEIMKWEILLEKK